MIKRLIQERQTQVRFIKFFIVGGTCYGLNVLFFSITKLFWMPSLAFTVAFVLSTGCHYSLNRFWALRSSRSDFHIQAIQYLVSVLMSYAISLTCFKLLSLKLGLGLTLAQALSIPPSTVVTFLVLNFWVFK